MLFVVTFPISQVCEFRDRQFRPLYTFANPCLSIELINLVPRLFPLCEGKTLAGAGHVNTQIFGGKSKNTKGGVVV